MIAVVTGAALGVIVAGPLMGLVGAFTPYVFMRLRQSETSPPPIRIVILLLLIEIRSGVSVLAALQGVSASLPGYRQFHRVARLATVSGLTACIEGADPTLRPIVAQLARAQRSGASLSGTLRKLLERDLADERARRLAKARSLPVRLMLPITLLMLPGLVLLLYAPTLFGLFADLTGAWR